MATQIERAVQLTSPLGEDVLLFSSMHAVERLSAPYRLDVNMQSLHGALPVDDILGKELSIRYNAPSGLTRHFHGIVTEFAQVDFKGDGQHQYRAQVRPWFWLLTCSADCRIFAGDTVPQIFEKVAQQHGFKERYELRLTGDFKPREYCVQYRETDFNFLNRLLEQEGIYYYFEHAADKHVMVLANDPSAHATIPDYETVPFFPKTDQSRRKRDHLTAWSFSKSMQPVAYATTDYDFKNPRKSLRATSTVARNHARTEKLEIFDYPAELAAFESDESERIARMRIEELQCRHLMAKGHGNAAGLTTGYRFTLTQHPREDLNTEYLIVATEYSLTSTDYSSGSGGGPIEFAVAVEAVDASVNYRAPRSTPKPLVHGSQTATVVGPEGEEISTDAYGRVKVKFHWDRDPETTSCWVRVSQMWAGSNWGWMSIPRVGQEVIVDFLEGDPDQPLITGRVYNQDNMPPYELEANKTQSGIKTRSTKGGNSDHFNEIRFEDKKGAEQLYIHAEKDQDIEVENDETHSVGHDRSKTVGHDERVHIKHNRTEKVDHNETVSIGGFHTETVSLAKAETIGLAKALTIGAAYQLSVGAGMNTTVALAQGEEVGLSKNVFVGKKFYVQAGDELEIVVGKSSLVMKADGSVFINGSQFNFSATGPVQISGKDIDLN
jgi:type VI secretion system secreted protein VgrG